MRVTAMKRTTKRGRTQFSCLGITEMTPLLQAEKFSSYTRLIRVTAWVMRFVRNCRRHNGSNPAYLTADEIQEASNHWIRHAQRKYYEQEIGTVSRGESLTVNSPIAQFQPFLDAQGLLRVKGRLQFSKASEDVKHPILLPKDHVVTRLIVVAAHLRTLHGGALSTMSELRECYWIPCCRQLVKKVISRCSLCAKHRLKPATAPTAPLPGDRVNRSEPFQVVGIDFAGPLFTKSKTSSAKSYIALFTCATTRAVHLELISYLSTECFLLALRRFVARRGLPQTIYSDNALTFKKASREVQSLWKILRSRDIQDYCGSQRITWKFIIEKAAWWGGWWERMVKSVKVSLRKVLGRQSLSFEELTTVLADVEAAINSRPLTYVLEEPGEASVLTPSHLLTGKRLIALPASKLSAVPTSTAADINRRWRYRRSLVNAFWNRWQREYLLQLRSAHLIFSRQDNSLTVGDIVIVHEDHAKPHMWKTGRVVEVFKGRDGAVRSCAVKLSTGITLRRPVQLLYPLETEVK